MSDLVNLGANQTNPYDAKASDFKVASSDKQTSSGKDQMVDCCDSPRHTEDGGPGANGYGTPVPSDRGAKVAAAFKVGQNDGGGGTSMSSPVSVDFVTGKFVTSTPKQKN